MTLKEAMADAIRRRDAYQAGRVVDQLRARGWTYQLCFALAQETTPWLDITDFDDLMAEADDLEAAS